MLRKLMIASTIVLLASFLIGCTPKGHYECRGGEYVQQEYTYLMPMVAGCFKYGCNYIYIPETGYRTVCTGTEIFVPDPPPRSKHGS